MDGTIYAAVASNLSQGNGTFWEMKFSETIMNPFYEHPPLAIWMESIFHRMLGDSFLSERIYSLVLWLINGYLIALIWKELKTTSSIKWIPMLLWMSIPIVVWSFSNNMLENTMGVFVSASVLFFLKGIKGNSTVWNILAGVMLVLAFLSKGFVGLFPFSMPVIYLIIFYREQSIWKHLLSGLWMMLGFALAALPLVLNNSSFAFITEYFDHQVKNSVENIQTVEHRFKIIEYFTFQTLIPISIGVVVYFIFRKKESNPLTNRKWSLAFLILSLCGVLPIMISLKQRDFYILTVYPFVVLSVVMYFENGFLAFQGWLERKIRKPLALSLSLLTFGVLLSIGSTQFYKRDAEVVKGTEELNKSEFRGQTFDCSNNIRYDWGVMANLSRFAKISVKVGYKSKYKVMFSEESYPTEKIPFRGLKLVK